MSISKIPNIPKLQDVKLQGYPGLFLNWDSNIIEFESQAPSHALSNGYCAHLVLSFTVKKNLAAYTNLFTLKDSSLIPKSGINFYQASNINGAFSVVAFQILNDGAIRTGIGLSANSTIRVQLTYPINVTGG